MYAMSNAALLNKYQSDSVMTASPMELIVMLYEGLIKQMRLSDIFLEENDYERANHHLLRAQDIVSELLRSLDLSYPISNNLMQLYTFMLEELADLNMQKDRTRLVPLLEIAGELKDAWVEVRNTGARAYATIEE